MTEAEIRELESEDEWRAAFPVVRQLRPHLDEEEFVSRVGRLGADGFRLFGLFENRESGENGEDEGSEPHGDRAPRAVAGVAIEHNLYDGRHVWVYDLVTDEGHRSRGFGAELCSFIEKWAADRGCETVALSSGLQRTDAHRFYEDRIGMERASYVFKKAV